MAEPLKGRVVHVINLDTDITGIDVLNNGGLFLDKFSTKLPLAALSDAVLAYITSQVSGGDGVADASNYYGSGSIASAANSNLISESVTSWKLRGIYGHGDEDATLAVTFTPDGGTAKTLYFEITNISSEVLFMFPNPIVLSDSSALTVNVLNNGNATDTFTVVAFGEDAI